MNIFPFEVELIICRYAHELNFRCVMEELKRESNERTMFELFIRSRVFYPYIFFDRMIKEKVLSNIYTVRRISKYVHYKKLSKCLINIIKPSHIYFDDL